MRIPKNVRIIISFIIIAQSKIRTGKDILEIITALANEFPEEITFQNALGKLYIQEGNLPEALNIFHQVIKNHHSDKWWFLISCLLSATFK